MELRDHLQKTLGDSYTIERELGGGGMARVFVAHDKTLGRRVVVKTLSADIVGGVSVERFRREIKLAASLQQANIVPVLSAGESDGLPYYTMPYVEGETLRTRIAAHGGLPLREVVGVLRDVGRALAFAHARGVVHRDIKPENVLLSGSTAVVTDFGIAKAIAASQTSPGASTLTHLGMALGTPAYLSPEQAAGDPDVDHRADIYSLGVLAYELLAGAPPFSGRSAQALLAAHVHEQPPPLAERCADAPTALVTLVTRCLEKDPDRRPQSAEEVLQLLESAGRPEPSTASGRAEEKPSIAVLPFANLSPDSADEYFADGLTDEIITDLSPIHSLRVIARASVMRFKSTGKEPLTVARELNVRYVLDGSVRRAGSSLRLTVRLLDARDGATVWTDKLGGSVDDVFAMQEKVSKTIVEALKLSLSPREEAHLRTRPITDLAAYEAYLQARQMMWVFHAASLNRATTLLRDAQERVGENVRLIAALGTVHHNYMDAGHDDPAAHLAALEDCVQRLARLDSASVAYHQLSGTLHFRRGEIREAIASFTCALGLDPNNADCLVLLAYSYLLAGQDDLAREAADAGVTLDPLTPVFRVMPGFCDFMAGRAEASLPHYRRCLEMDAANPFAHLMLAWALTEAGHLDEAREYADTLANSFPSTVMGQLGGALAAALSNDRAASLRFMTSEVRTLPLHSETFARLVASIFVLAGDVDTAIGALENAVRLGFAHYPHIARHSAILTRLRGHSRFDRLLDVVRERWKRGGTSAADLATQNS